MALILSPINILKDLRCNLDFTNPRSYRSGNTIFDITSNSNNGILNNITYSTIFGGTGVFSVSSSIVINNSLTLNASPLNSRTTSFWYFLSGDPIETTVLYKEGNQNKGIIVYIKDNYLNCVLYAGQGLYSIKKQTFTTGNQWHNLVFNYYNTPPYLEIFHDLGKDDYDIVSEPISTFLVYNGEQLTYNDEDLLVVVFNDFEPTTIILGSLSGSSVIDQQIVTGNGINDYNLRGSINNFFTKSNEVLTETEIKDNYNLIKGKYGISNSPAEIPRQGLICHLDPSNKNSYIEGQKMWNDISYNDNDAIFFNGATPAQSGNAINFDGVDEYASIQTNPFIKNKEPFTRIIWFKYNNINTSGYQDVNILGNDTYNTGSKLTVNTQTQILTSSHTLNAVSGSELFLKDLNIINNNLPRDFDDFNKINSTDFDDIKFNEYSIVVQKNNKVYAYGFDGGSFGNNVLSADNKFASPYTGERFLTKFLELNVPYDFKKLIDIGYYHLILSAHNDLYYSRSNNWNIFLNPNPFRFQRSSSLKFDNIKSDSFYTDCFLALSGGRLWAGGYVEGLGGGNNLGKGSPGLGSFENFTLISPTSTFTDIFPGASSSFVLSGNKMFSTGWSATNGHNTNRTQFTLLSGEWKKVVSSLNAVFALSADNKSWFSLGNINDTGWLGVGDYSDRSLFTKIVGEMDDIIYIDVLATFVLGISGSDLYYSGIFPNMTQTNTFTYLGKYNFNNVKRFFYYTDLSNFPEDSIRKPNSFFEDAFIGTTNPRQSITKKTETFIKNLSGWNMIVQSYDSNLANKLYIIGKEKTQIIDYPVSELIFEPDNNTIKIGEIGLGCDIGTVLMYNRELQHTEIIKVFNATKKRFGY